MLPATEYRSVCCWAPSHRAKLLQELDSICFCTRGDHEYKIPFEVLPSGTRALVVCTQNFVVKKISLLKIFVDPLADEDFLTRKFITRKFLNTKISRFTVCTYNVEIESEHYNYSRQFRFHVNNYVDISDRPD